jgi:hypothetical protein
MAVARARTRQGRVLVRESLSTMTCEPLSGRPRRLDTPTTRDPRHALAWSCSQCLRSERPVPPPFRPTRDDGRAGRPHCIRPGTATSIAVRTDITMSACPRIVPCRTGDRSPGWHLITPPLTADERARPPARCPGVRARTDHFAERSAPTLHAPGGGRSARRTARALRQVTPTGPPPV